MRYFEEEIIEDRTYSLKEQVDQYTEVYGLENPSRAWVLSPFDVWERNPFYSGPYVPHPEEEDFYEDCKEGFCEDCKEGCKNIVREVTENVVVDDDVWECPF